MVFDHLKEHNLKLKPSKCEFFTNKINYLAHHISKNGIKPSHKNLKAMVECSPPQTYTKVQAFLGLVGHYSHFIKDLAQKAKLLHKYLAGEGAGKKSESLTLTEEAWSAFNVLKKACLTAPVLIFADYGKPFLLETDTSKEGLGAVLLQKQDNG